MTFTTCDCQIRLEPPLFVTPFSNFQESSQCQIYLKKNLNVSPKPQIQIKTQGTC